MKIQSKIKADFPHYVFGNFFKCSRAANSAVHGQIVPKFEPVRDFMVVLLTCKNEEDTIINGGARVLTRLCRFFRRSRAANSEVSGGILRKFELVQAFMVVLVTHRIQSKMKELECKHDFPHFKSMGVFSSPQGQLTPQSVVESGLNSYLSKIL